MSPINTNLNLNLALLYVLPHLQHSYFHLFDLSCNLGHNVTVVFVTVFQICWSQCHTRMSKRGPSTPGLLLDGRNKHRRRRDIQRQLRQPPDLPPNTAHNVRLFVARQFPPPVEVFSIGHMNIQCQNCQALCFPREALNCCHNGKVSLPPLSPYPQEMQDLLTKNNSQARNFRENICQYNSAMAFASFGVNILPTDQEVFTHFAVMVRYIIK